MMNDDDRRQGLRRSEARANDDRSEFDAKRMRDAPAVRALGGLHVLDSAAMDMQVMVDMACVCVR